MLDEGFWAEIRVGGEHLRLFSERNALGVQTSVYNVNTKTWIAPSESVEDIEQGKERAAARAEAYLKQIANLELPTLVWKRSYRTLSWAYASNSFHRSGEHIREKRIELREIPLCIKQWINEALEVFRLNEYGIL
jgi:hypothetical protein